jgi:hypothetical protein
MRPVFLVVLLLLLPEASSAPGSSLPAEPLPSAEISPLPRRTSSLPAAATRFDRRCWSVDESDPERLVLIVEIGELQWMGCSAGVGCLAVPGFAERDLIDGAEWPALHLPAALPPGARFSIAVEIEGRRRLARTVEELRRQSRTGRDAEEPFAEAEGDDSCSRWRPVDAAGFVQVGAPAVCSYLRLLPIRIFPVRSEESGALISARRIRVILEFDRESPETRPLRSGQHGLGDLQLATVMNPRQAAQWRDIPPVLRRGREGDSFASATSAWLRIEVEQRGVYVLTAEDLGDLGIDSGGIDLAELRLFCADAGAIPETLDVAELPTWMEPCALLIEDDGDDVWDEATRVYFLGNGPDGWRADLGLAAPTPDDRYYAHPHSNHFTYWLCWEGSFSSEPLRMTQLDAEPGALPLIETAVGRLHVEENDNSHAYDSRPRAAAAEWQRFFEVLIKSGKTGYVPVHLGGVVSERGATVRVSVWGASWDAQHEDDHEAVAYVNGDSLAVAGWENVEQVVLRGTAANIAESNAVTVYVPPRSLDGTTTRKDDIYLAWVEVDYTKHLQTESDSLEFFVTADSAATHAFRISGLAVAGGWLLLDASSFRTPVVLEPAVTEADGGYRADFRVTPAGEEAHLVLLQRSDAATPPRMTRESWHQDSGDGLLRARTAAVDYLIVTGAQFRAAADAIREHREQYYPGAGGDTLTTGRVALIGVGPIFDEFAWGQHDPTALRNFVSHARTNWRGQDTTPTLSYLLLVGNAYYDPRCYLGGTVADVVPSHHNYDWRRQLTASWSPAYFSDDWYGFLDGPGDEGLDLSIGRLPAATDQQAWNMVDKIVAYDTQAPAGDWRTRLTLAADDVCQGLNPDNLGYDHMIQTERLSNEGVPGDARQRKIFLYEYGSECEYDRKPAATADLLETIESGTLLFDFVGHGSEIQLADERLMEKSTIPSLENYGKPFLMITASCAVGKFAHGGDGLALNIIRIENRGALAVLSASSMASSVINFNLNNLVLQGLFPDGSLLTPAAFGPALLWAKWINAASNDRRYNLFGDPASRFVTPARRIDLWLEDVPGMASGADTLIRGGGAVVRGRVTDLEGSPISGFSGQAEVLVLDSDIHRSPRAGSSAEDYWLPGARIFSGTADISGGEFSCRFFVPTALRTGERGPARIHVYADGKEQLPTDATGVLVDLWIPERVVQSPDVTGPVITLEWEDSAAPITEGSWVQASLSDSSGIYVAALSPSRSVVVTIEDEDDRILVAEDLAGTVVFENDFREATVAYEIPDGLPAGRTLTLNLEASDNLNHRSRATLTFEIAGGAGGSGRCLTMVYAIPNPTESSTRFLFELEETADLDLTIFTATGRKIRRFSSHGMSPVHAAETGIYWDGRDADGDPLANGVYFYRVVACGSDGRSDERIERLVVLR